MVGHRATLRIERRVHQECNRLCTRVPPAPAPRLAGRPRGTGAADRQRISRERSATLLANSPFHHILAVDPEPQLNSKARPRRQHTDLQPIEHAEQVLLHIQFLFLDVTARPARRSR
jgi:hypothetical protein